MTQEATQLPTTPPYPGLQMVQDINELAQTLGTDLAGDADPAGIAWPYSTWADTGTGTIKRRNVANSAWVIEGRLFRSHMPIIPLAEVPTTDIGPIHIIGVGPAEWGGAAYEAMISGLPGATFTEIAALTEDDGPIICTDMGGAVYVWDGVAYAPLLGDEAHAGALKLATAALALALTDDTTAITPAKLGEVLSATVPGLSQTWQDVTASRAVNVIYTNTTSAQISIAGQTTSPASVNGYFQVDGVNVIRFSNSSSAPIGTTWYATVPAGSTYRTTGASSIGSWVELR